MLAALCLSGKADDLRADLADDNGELPVSGSMFRQEVGSLLVPRMSRVIADGAVLSKVTGITLLEGAALGPCRRCTGKACRPRCHRELGVGAVPDAGAAQCRGWRLVGLGGDVELASGLAH